MKKAILICLSFFICALCQSQPAYDLKRDYTWVFARQWGGNDIPNHDAYKFIFSGDTLRIEEDSFNTTINYASIGLSDKGGELILYSHGCAIYGVDNEIIINGADINQGYFNDVHCPDGIINSGGGILLLPVSDSTYFLIYQRLSRINEIFITDLVYYSKIQQLADGQFEVVEKDQILAQDLDLIRGQIALGRHANGKDWWLIFISNGNSKLIFSLDESGFNQEPEQEIGNSFVRRDGSSGSTLISPDGTKMVSYNAYSDLHIFDFDRCSGELSNPINIPIKDEADNVLAAGAAISPNSRFVYLPSTQHIYQYDLWADNIEESREVIAIYDDFRIGPNLPTRFFQAQLAPDGKIYIGSASNRGVWHVIEKPNEKGTACKVNQHKIVIPVGLYTSGMPHYPNFRLGPLVGSPCDTLDIPSQLSITAHPYDQMVCKGGLSTHFEVTAHGNELEYQWQTNLNGFWEDSVNDTLFSGSKSHDLQMAYTETSMEGWQFRCIVTSDIGVDTTNAATLNISEKESVTVDFDVKISEDTANFINLTQHAENYFWTFGNGTYDTIPSPNQIIYSQNRYVQKYGLELYVENECSAAYVSDSITIEIPKAIARFEVEPNFSCNVGDTIYIREVSENRHRIVSREWRFDCCDDWEVVSETPEETLIEIIRETDLFPGKKELELRVCDLIGCDTIKLDTAYFYYEEIKSPNIRFQQLSDRKYIINYGTTSRDVEERSWYDENGTLIAKFGRDTSWIEIEFPKDSIYTIIGEIRNRCFSSRDTLVLDVRTTGITKIEDGKKNYSYYPNPTSNNLVLENSPEVKPQQLIIYNSIGKLVKTMDLSSNSIAHDIQLSELSDGVYFLIVKSEFGLVALEPLVISR